jgi:UDP-N-acetylglucosamine acyltransferase
MPISPSARIHRTAIVSPLADIGDNVDIGAFAVVEGAVRLGADCIVRPHGVLVGPITMGRGNQVFSGAVLGERPQHLKYNDEPTRLEIGDYNVFREHVTVHRGTTQAWVTRLGNHNYLMAGSHVGHDCTIGNQCILTNGALVGGHCLIEDNVYLSGNSAIHQFIRIGRLAMLQGCSAATKDVPPFIVNHGINVPAGVNIVGMRRAGLSPSQITAVRQAYKIVFRQGLLLSLAIERLEREFGAIDVIQELVTFLKNSPKGISSAGTRSRADAA